MGRLTYAAAFREAGPLRLQASVGGDERAQVSSSELRAWQWSLGGPPSPTFRLEGPLPTACLGNQPVLMAITRDHSPGCQGAGGKGQQQ